MSPSEEIKAKLNILDIIREYISVQQAGASWKARCPFHRENTPSFNISPEKQAWYCFGCGKGGDIFTFVQEIEKVDFKEALKILAPKAGVTLKKQNIEELSKRGRLIEIMEISRRYYHKVLMESPLANSARAYLKKRGITGTAAEDWQIGFSPDSWDDLMMVLRKKNFNDKDIFQAGMSSSKPETNRFYNRFRGRIMFPINNQNGETVAFSARVSPEKEKTEKMGKYINSPQSPIYDKSRILFGLDKAKAKIKELGFAIVVEGQMDVITSHLHGFENTVASSGTALTEDQIKLLKRFTNTLYLAFDMDEAGARASDRGIKEALKAEMEIMVVEAPQGKDPDECIRNNPKDWQEAIARAKPMMQYHFDKTFRIHDPKDIRGKREAVKHLLPIIIGLENKIEEDYWIKRLSEQVDVEEYLIRETIKLNTAKTAAPAKAPETPHKENAKISKEEQLSELFLSILIRYPVLIEYSLNHLDVNQLSGQSNQDVYKNLIFYYNTFNDRYAEDKLLDSDNFKSWLKDEQRPTGLEDQLRKVDRLVVLIDKEFREINLEKAKKELIATILQLKQRNLVQERKRIERLLIQAEKEKDEKRAEELMEELRSLSH